MENNNKFHLKSEGEKKQKQQPINHHFPWEKLKVLPKMLLLITN